MPSCCMYVGSSIIVIWQAFLSQNWHASQIWPDCMRPINSIAYPFLFNRTRETRVLVGAGPWPGIESHRSRRHSSRRWPKVSRQCMRIWWIISSSVPHTHRLTFSHCHLFSSLATCRPMWSKKYPLGPSINLSASSICTKIAAIRIDGCRLNDSHFIRSVSGIWPAIVQVFPWCLEHCTKCILKAPCRSWAFDATMHRWEHNF